MPFHFSLLPVLRLRQSLERRERMRLLLLGGQISQVRQQCERLEQEKEMVRAELTESLKGGMAGIEFHFAQSNIAAHTERKEALARQMAELEEKRKTQQAAYQEAQKQRKILDNLRERYLQAYHQEQSRREHQQIDEIFMLRRRRITDV